MFGLDNTPPPGEPLYPSTNRPRDDGDAAFPLAIVGLVGLAIVVFCAFAYLLLRALGAIGPL